ncbi:zinc finger protein 180-like [Xyrichtys novacula]|uniref:Zinc finger protein 180-like n=1 Tax=Xyrichtys novacula TaxID=13765 RepID=A0AAV1HCW7_XYRNO|nr:zinc finger protein 180-like [Xyrichtys novacula]
MSKVQILKVFINQRLSAAAEEIFELFERTILEYEEKLCGSKENQHKQMENPNRADIQQLQVHKEEVLSEQQRSSTSLDQEDPIKPPHIKEEEEGLWARQEGEQLQRREEAEISMVTLMPLPVKSEEGRKQTEENRDGDHLKTKVDGESCRGSEPDMDFNPGRHVQLATDEETSPSDSDTDDSSWDWEEISELRSSFNSQQNKEETFSNAECSTVETSVSSFECAASSGQNEHLQDKGIQTEEKQYSCHICDKRYSSKKCLQKHTIRHSEEKSYSCSVCKRSFNWRGEYVRHMRTHTGEKPYSCSVCGKRFSLNGNLTQHFAVHTGEKPFSCSVCGHKFTHRGALNRHSVVHSGEKPYSCSICGRRFGLPQYVKLHKCGSKNSRCK